MTTLFMSYAYFPPVGHTVEALRYTRGLFEAQPDLKIHLALSDRSAPELTKGCPWIAATYPIHLADFDDPATGRAAVARLPRLWDYVIEDTDVLDTGEIEINDALHTNEQRIIARQLRNYYPLISTMLLAKRGRGATSPDLRLPVGLQYRPQSQVTLSVPERHQAFAKRYDHNGPKVCVLLGGSDHYYRYPDVSSWIKILDAIRDAFPTTRFYLTGVSQSANGKTSTAGYTNDAVRAVLATGRDVVNCYDIGLWNQIALMERCDLLISPHTGFAFVALCVGTPWLTLSGGHFAEYFFNNVPFYSVLPDDPEFPYQGKIYPEGSVAKLPSMRPEHLDRKIPEVVEAMHLLLDKNFTYEQALERYRDNIAQANVNRPCLLLPTHPALRAF